MKFDALHFELYKQIVFYRDTWFVRDTGFVLEYQNWSFYNLLEKEWGNNPNNPNIEYVIPYEKSKWSLE